MGCHTNSGRWRKQLRFLGYACLIVLSCIVWSGCSGEMTQAEYEKEMEKVGKEVDGALAMLGSNPDNAPTGKEIRNVSDQLEDAAKKMDEIDPPEKVLDEHQKMISGLRGISKAFSELANELDSAESDRDRMEAFLDIFNKKKTKAATEKIEEAQRGYENQGYRIFR